MKRQTQAVLQQYDMIESYLTPPQMMLSLGGGYEYVDLGLPSGLKWAKCNVGAETETDYGDYFQWGSTTPNTNTICNWSTCPFNNGASDYNEEYFNAHKSEWLNEDLNEDSGEYLTLKPKFDAATQIMGGDWRMPTDAEISELLSNTNKQLIDNYNGSSVNGLKLTSKINGNSIFIPKSGYRRDSEFINQGIRYDIWGSSFRTPWPRNACTLYYFSGEYFPGYYYDRAEALCVRGVRE